jgi:tyrosine-protein phosphatase SIW14
MAGLLLTLSLAIPAAAGDASTIRIDNFGRVDATYYRGAQPQGRDYTDLAALGVKAVINLTSDDADASEKGMTERVGMHYFQIPMTTHQVPSAPQLAEFMKIVADPANQPVYVHCVGGRHRTGVMTAIYRMMHDGWDATRAFTEMKQYKFGADFLHPEFKQFVYDYRATLAHAAAEAAAPATTKAGGPSAALFRQDLVHRGNRRRSLAHG